MVVWLGIRCAGVVVRVCVVVVRVVDVVVVVRLFVDRVEVSWLSVP